MTSRSPLALVTLTGTYVRLEPLNPSHLPGLKAAVSGPRNSFTYAWVPTPDAQDLSWYLGEADRRYAAGTGLSFATISLIHPDANDRPQIVGSTRFMEAEYWTTADRHPRIGVSPDAIEIGGTWLIPKAQRSPINTEAKTLMLAYAFESLGVQRVTIKTDARNIGSRTAIERIGAQLEGIRRAHMRGSDGAVRDTAYYSILHGEWPGISLRLQALLADPMRDQPT